MFHVIKDFLQLIFITFVLLLSSSVSSSELPSIYLVANTAIYNSDITKKNVEIIKELYQQHKFSTLTITSPGGDYDAGMDLGVFIFKNHIKVNVPKYCASSCTFAFFMTRPNMRSMNDNAIIAIHNITFTSNIDGDKRMYVSINEITQLAEAAATKAATMYSIYASVGIPPRIMLASSKLRGNNAIIITKADLLEWGTIKQ